MKHNLLQELTRRPLVCDGAMGTQLFEAGLAPGLCPELWNVEHSDIVETIGQHYRDAGCDLLTTNTFGGCRMVLEGHGFGDRVEEMNRTAVEVARRAAGDQGFVLGDIGPCGQMLEPFGDLTEPQAHDTFVEQAQVLFDAGADAATIETMTDANEMKIALRCVREVAKDWPIIATYAFNKPVAGVFNTMMGLGVDDAVAAAVEAGASVVGTNCGTDIDLDEYALLAEQLVSAAKRHGDIPVIVQPNAGAPMMKEGKLFHPATPLDMADLVPRLLEIGVRIIGGCCGTTPDHMQAMAAVVHQDGV